MLRPLLLAIVILILPVTSAQAVKPYTIILRAAGSGAVLGLGAGLISYPFAKSTDTIIAGVLLGAIMGTAYGYAMVVDRQTNPPVTWVPNAREQLREFSSSAGADRGPVLSEMNVVHFEVPVFRFD